MVHTRAHICHKNNGPIHQVQLTAEFRMGLQAGQIISITCVSAGITYPHYGIIVVGAPKQLADADVLQYVRVVHFCRGDPSSLFDDGTMGAPQEELRVRETTLAWFISMGTEPKIVVDITKPPSFSVGVIVRRARSFLGAADYKVYKRKCQSFVTHCVYGQALSYTVQRAGMLIGGTVIAFGACIIVASYRLAITQWL